MAFLEEKDMGTTIYEYQIEQIADGNDEAMPDAISAAIEEARSYLTQNDRKEYSDGRPHYDVQKIFAKTGIFRNPVLLQKTKTIAKFHFIDLCNADIMYERAQKNYDRAVAYLKDLAKGVITLSDLELVIEDTTTTTDEPLPYRSGSRTKFNHE
ncbi:hypothetical protein AB670_02768 [Chryseobacterium sp. MOF25P]|uniref:hypothetical protein n=1 Tax=unclassified Chryseobacterium TaxID=2593645 RepID=UPI0008051057|nr:MULTISPECIES: hypothetical protein [unclassified Chryseobacterium]OBW40817.1 hypothetical protein AB670_02768 [Chryseobacterium sp. MOF25P]OBW45281.1 hypothetical protein AB671_02578 [Chryseobacterium sp. BGARF1]